MPLTWRVMSADGRKVLHEAVAPSFAVPLPGGGVRVEVTSGRIAITRDIEIAKEGDTVLDVALDAGIVRFDTGAKRLASDAEEPLIFLEKLSTQRTGTDVRDGGRTSTPLWIARGKAIEAMLPPGDYRAVAEYGLARAVAPVRVAAGQALNLSLPLEAGRLELATVPQGGDDVVYRVEVDDPDRAGGRRELTRTAHAAPVFVLSTGTYYVTATTGGDEVRRLVTVRSGEVTRETFNLDLVSLEVDATINGAAEPRAPLTLASSGSMKRALHRPHPSGSCRSEERSGWCPEPTGSQCGMVSTTWWLHVTSGLPRVIRNGCALISRQRK